VSLSGKKDPAEKRRRRKEKDDEMDEEDEQGENGDAMEVGLPSQLGSL